MISAGNQLDVLISEVLYGPVSVLLILQTKQGVRMVASVSKSSATAMRLREGERVIAVFQASHVLVATGWAMGISARNKLSGRVHRITMGVVNAEIDLLLEGMERIVAVITNEAVAELRLKDGDEIVAIIKASDVMIAK